MPWLFNLPAVLPARPIRSGGGVRAACAAAVLASGVALAGCGGDSTGLGFNLVSQDQLADMGTQAWQEMRAQTPASDNAEYQRTARRIADRLLKAAGKDPSEWEVVVFQGEEANAFALPGRKIGVYEGMFRVAQNDAQLAAVMGHEIAHNDAEHAAERMSTQLVTEAGVQIASAAAGSAGGLSGQQIAALLGAGAQYGLVLPYSRNQELEADRLGLTYMARAGYDPRAAVDFWQRMKAAADNGTPAFLSTHPAPDQRIAQIRELLPDALAAYRE